MFTVIFQNHHEEPFILNLFMNPACTIIRSISFTLQSDRTEMNHFQSLLDGLSEVDTKFWRDVATLQKNWFGKCDGMSFRFKLEVCISLH